MSPHAKLIACQRKAAKFRGAAAARQEARALERRKGEPLGACVEYQCPACGFWHVGRRPRYRQQLRRAHLGPFDPALADAIGMRAYGHGHWENTSPGSFRAWLRDRVPELVAKRRAQAC